ncbi:MAG: MoaD/ThiS family protein [Anaerolineae bacterium]|jgi:molybdopterin converting factor small subunit
MKVSVKLGAPLSQVVGESKVVLRVPDDATAEDVLDLLQQRYPEFGEGLKGKGLREPFDQVVYSLFVNARPVSFDDAAKVALRDGDRVYLFLPVAGG